MINYNERLQKKLFLKSYFQKSAIKIHVTAFPFKAKRFAIAFLSLLLFFLLVTFFGQNGKIYFQIFLQLLL